MDIKQGNTIKFISVFKDTISSDAYSWDEVDNVIIYAYTCLNYVVKFSMRGLYGYNQLKRIDSKHLVGAILPNQSKFMEGDLMIEICIKSNDSSIIDGGYSNSIYTDIIDGGDSFTIPVLDIDGNLYRYNDVDEVGINAVETGITIVKSIIKAEV